MPVTPTPISSLPTPPSRADSANFAARGDAFLGALPTFRTETNAVATNVYNNAVEADADATSAAASAQSAANSAAAASASAQAATIASNVSAWVSGQTYATGTSVYSPINYLTYRRLASSPGASTTDPSADATRWVGISGTVQSVALNGGATGLTVSGSPITTSGTLTLGGTLNAASGGTGLTSPGAAGNVLTSDGTNWTSTPPSGLPEMVVVTGTSQTASALKHYVLTNAAATTVTLPAAPLAGAVVWVTVANGRTDNVIARNGSNIQSLAENLTINAAYAAVQLRYADATRGWIFT